MGLDGRRFLRVAGPGLVVMLAGSDAGSLITAAQSGAQWGYRLLPLQFLLIPVLYCVQEQTVRLGLASGKGYVQLVRERFGAALAWACAALVVASCLGALLTELSGLVGVGALFGVPARATLAAVVALLGGMAATHRYLTVERVALALGAFELVFLIVAALARPDATEIAAQAMSPEWGDATFLYMAAANVGAVVSPWMLVFQQASVVERGLDVGDLGAARLDTALGAVATQMVMAATLVAAAAILSRPAGAPSLAAVQDIAAAITPFLGEFAGKLLFGLGMTGASLAAAIVVTLTAGRALAEAVGAPSRLDLSPREAPGFYAGYAAALIVGAALVGAQTDLVALSVAVQVVNALLLPLALAFLFALARGLPGRYRLGGIYGAAAAGVTAIAAILGAAAGFASLLG